MYYIFGQTTNEHNMYRFPWFFRYGHSGCRGNEVKWGACVKIYTLSFRWFAWVTKNIHSLSGIFQKIFPSTLLLCYETFNGILY